MSKTLALKLIITTCFVVVAVFAFLSFTQNAYAATACPAGGTKNGSTCCGGGYNAAGQDYPRVQTSIDLGCTGNGNPIADLVFAVIRLLADGVGIVVIVSVIIGGIQYSTSRGDPEATAHAMKRVSSSLIALLIYIFAYAILNYVIPGGFLK